MATPQLILAASTGESSGDALALLVILATAGLVALAMAVARLPVVPAYLIAGVIIGPGAAGLIEDAEQVQAVADLAIVLLMFGIGMHLDLGQLKGSLTRLLAAAIGSIAACTAMLMPCALLLPVSWAGALTVAMALSLSSTAVVLKLLHTSRRLTQSSGRLSLAILLVQDLAVVAMLIVLPVLAEASGAGPPKAEGEADGPGLLLVVAGAVGAVAAVMLTGRLLLPRLLSLAASRRAGEVLMVLALAFALGAALLTRAAGLSAELGAFLAGLLLASTPFRHQLTGQVGPLRDLFIAVFFTALGTKLDLGLVGQAWPSILIATAVLLSVKTVCGAAACWAAGATPALAITAGLWLAQGGEFGLVLLTLAQSPLGLITERTLNILTALIIVTLILSPPMFTLAPRWAARLGRGAPMAPWRGAGGLDDAPPAAPHAGPDAADAKVIVAGFGVVGRAVVGRLRADGFNVTVIEMNPSTVRTQRSLGLETIYGDAANLDVLEHAGIAHARAIILTVPDEQAVLRAVQLAREANPNIYILARTNYMSRGMVAKSLGANDYIVEELVTAEAMDRMIARALGRPGTADDEPPPPDA